MFIPSWLHLSPEHLNKTSANVHKATISCQFCGCALTFCELPQLLRFVAGDRQGFLESESDVTGSCTVPIHFVYPRICKIRYVVDVLMMLISNYVFINVPTSCNKYRQLIIVLTPHDECLGFLVERNTWPNDDHLDARRWRLEQQ